MKEITLKSLLLENFKGVESSGINFDNASVNIYGDNATGKTTHLDAFIWCLFNKDSLNSANFEIKALDLTGEAAHNLTHSVTVTLDIDGKPLTLKKNLEEQWTRKRGDKSKTFTGHTTTYFVDGVPVKKKEYDGKVNDVIDEKSFRLLTDARFFNEQLTWKDRRDLIMTICGDVSVQDVIESEKSLEPVVDILDGRSIEDARTALNGQRKEINRELEKIPVRIDEATRSIADLEMPVKDAEVGLKALAVEKSELEKEMAALANGGGAAKLRVELQEAKAERQKTVNDFEASKAERSKKAQGQLAYLEAEYNKKKREQDKLGMDLERTINAIASRNSDLKDLRKEWHEIDSMVFDGSDTCPTCGQALPADQLAAAVEKFNLSKAEMLKYVNSKGKTNKETLVKLEASKADLEKTLKSISNSLDIITNNMAPFKAEIETISAELCDTTELTRNIGELEIKIREAEAGENKDQLSGIAEQLDRNAKEQDARKNIIAQAKANKATEARIEDLKSQETSLVEAVCEIEKNLFLLDELTRAKVNVLEERINSRFKVARFKMFSDQINGGLAETCEVTLDGVPYGSMNSAGRIQVGLDIIATLQDHYGVSCPIWIDNRESVVSIPDIDAQVISLIVTDNCPSLKVETVKKSQEKAA